eukprot:6209112-Pleurochrysis_carterae.AAC.1
MVGSPKIQTTSQPINRCMNAYQYIQGLRVPSRARPTSRLLQTLACAACDLQRNACYASSDLDAEDFWYQKLTFHRYGLAHTAACTILLMRFRVFCDWNADSPDV